MAKILDSSKVKGFGDANFKFDENGRKFSFSHSVSKRLVQTRACFGTG